MKTKKNILFLILIAVSITHAQPFEKVKELALAHPKTSIFRNTKRKQSRRF
jgi:hypothetical protein